MLLVDHIGSAADRLASSVGRAACSLSPQAEREVGGGFLRRGSVLFVVAVAVRLAVAALVRAPSLSTGFEPGVVADNLLAGRGFVFDFYESDVPRHAFIPPLYPGLIALARFACGDAWLTGIQVFQALFAGLGALALRSLALKVVRPSLAWATAYLYALWPPLVFYATLPFAVSLEAAGIPAILCLVHRTAAARAGLWSVAASGAGYGILAYSQPAFLGSLVFVPFGLHAAGRSWRRGFTVAAGAFVVAMVVVSPWLLRNHRVTGHFVPVASNLGFNLAGSNNPYCDESINSLCKSDSRTQLLAANQLESMHEADFDRWLVGQGVRYIIEHPGESLIRVARRAVYYWWLNPHLLKYSGAKGMGHMVLMSVALPLFVAGLIFGFSMRRRSPLGVEVSVVMWATAFWALFIIRGRYSLLGAPLMLLFVVIGVAGLVQLHRRAREIQS